MSDKTFAQDHGLCACTLRFDVNSGTAEPLDTVSTPFTVVATPTGFYDVVAATGHRANSLSLCEHEAQRLSTLLNK